jgi:hypothetical protein
VDDLVAAVPGSEPVRHVADVEGVGNGSFH